jgi:hypothetical protein
MTIEKQVLTNLVRCYATAHFNIRGKSSVLVATEGEGACYAFTGADYGERTTVWAAPGGTMSIVPIPGTHGEFLAIQKFFKLFQWDEAVIVWAKPQPEGGFAVREILHMPYIHRFDLFQAGDRMLFIGCTLADSKETRDDWSKPGKIYVGELGASWNHNLSVSVLRDGLYRNHGFARSIWEGREAALVGCEQGAFAVTPPRVVGGEWSVEQFMDWPISDIAACDIDGDGELEYATIEPFHGQYYRVYKRIGDGWRRVYQHPEISEFYHVDVGAKLCGTPVFVGGCRRGSQHLFYLKAASKSPLQLEVVTIENYVGPSNVVVFAEADRDVIVSANREKGEAALYYVRD